MNLLVAKRVTETKELTVKEGTARTKPVIATYEVTQMLWEDPKTGKLYQPTEGYEVHDMHLERSFGEVT